MHNALGLAHASIVHRLHAARARAAQEDGQGTVEYVGLLILMAALMGAVAKFSGNTGINGDAIGKEIASRLKSAVEAVN